MYRGIYVGGLGTDLFNKSALFRDSTCDDKVLAQFDALFLRESHGWHEFARSDFVNVRKTGGSDE